MAGGEILRGPDGTPTGLLLAKPNAGILYATLAKGPKLPFEYQLNSTRNFMHELNRLGVTGAIRLGADELTNRTLLVSVFGCNAAWGIVDGVVLVLTRVFERGRLKRLAREAHGVSDDEAFALVEGEFATHIVSKLTP